MNARCASLLTVLLTALLPALVEAQTIRRQVVANGGVTMTGSAHRITGTVGQAAIGRSSGVGTILHSGYWRTAALPGGASLQPEVVPDMDRPRVLAFTRTWPNPTAGAMRFGVDLPDAAHVDLQVLDVQGRRVRVVEQRRLEAGSLALHWDARDDRGARVRPGVYFARLVVDGRLVGDRRVVLTE